MMDDTMRPRYHFEQVMENRIRNMDEGYPGTLNSIGNLTTMFWNQEQ